MSGLKFDNVLDYTDEIELQLFLSCVVPFNYKGPAILLYFQSVFFPESPSPSTQYHDATYCEEMISSRWQNWHLLAFYEEGVHIVQLVSDRNIEEVSPYCTSFALSVII